MSPPEPRTHNKNGKSNFRGPAEAAPPGTVAMPRLNLCVTWGVEHGDIGLFFFLKGQRL